MTTNQTHYTTVMNTAAKKYVGQRKDDSGDDGSGNLEVVSAKHLFSEKQSSSYIRFIAAAVRPTKTNTEGKTRRRKSEARKLKMKNQVSSLVDAYGTNRDKLQTDGCNSSRMTLASTNMPEIRT